MAINSSSYEHGDEDYIDIEIRPHSNSPPHPSEFEFKMSSSSLGRETTTSSADELFYKGKLLPLHLPPRLQMVQKLLHNSNTTRENKTEAFKKHHSTPFTTTKPSTTTTSTPYESCNISTSDSCGVSGELNPDEYFLDCSTEVSCFISEHPKKSWSKKLKQSSLGLKLKASRAYLKSLFSKSGCAEAAGNGDEGTVSKAKECLNKYMKVAKKDPFGQIPKDRYQMSATTTRGIDREKMIKDGGGGHRKSFSGAIKHHLTTNSLSSSSSSVSSSSSFSSNSDRFYELKFLKRSNSANSGIESSIQGAIAHCKQSQELFLSRKITSEDGFCSLSASSEDQERPGLCRSG
ncbi:hypothetical protein HHK36_016487 [Tetracentron sinense]|uniref:Membrane-associated kinase regulator 4 n=1 Tax=Tetracentron sinense TaxID=13715 RepID=A0A834Z5V5_TETSI|nr:hypothetical protein HHK36_016487 [Tetracentron sinense]